MSGFDYGNARLHALKARLLPRPLLEGWAEVGSVESLIAALAATAYHEAVEAALARRFATPIGMDCLAEALRGDLAVTLGRARQFFDGPAGALVALVLRRYDLHNVKTILRGLAHSPASARDILDATLPVGELRAAELSELARCATVYAAIDLLATWAMPFAPPLLALRARRSENAEVSEMELALERWHLRTALLAVQESGETGEALLAALRLEADAMNTLTALRLVGAVDAARLRAHAGADDLTALFVGPGHLRVEHLAAAARQPTVSEAVRAFAETPYGPLLQSAGEAYSSTHRLSAFERAFARRQLQHAALLLIRDPLGIGVLLGYAALKINEAANVRAIAHGLALAKKPAHIRAELMFA